MSDGADLELVAAGLRADAREMPALLNGLGAWFEEAVPHLVRVERKRAGLLDSRRLVTRITCQVGEDAYVLERQGGGAVARRGRVVRGITLRTETLTLAEWLSALGAALRTHAEVSDAAARSLRDLLTG